MRETVIAGIGIVPFGVYDGTPHYVLATAAIRSALKDSGFEWRDIQAAFCGSVYQGTGSGHQALREIGLMGMPVINNENACSSSAVSLRSAYQAVAAGIYDIVIAVGFEKMPRGPIASTAFRDWQLKMGMNIQPGNYALETVEYMHQYGVSIDDISRVTIKNRKNASMNPNARFRTAVDMETINASRIIASPLRLYHCAPIADGAACAIVCTKEKAKELSRCVTVAASQLLSCEHGQQDMTNGMPASVKHKPKEHCIAKCARLAYEAAGIGPEDINVAQVYDSMAPAELWHAELLGFCGYGEAPRLLREGHFDIGGKLPTNTDGGLMGRGHPLGATGMAQICEIVAQLRGEAGPRQVEKARIGLTHAMGAGPNTCITILKK